MREVSIARIDKDYKNALEVSLNLIGGLGSFIKKDDSVILKPNLNDFESYTSVELVEALIEMLLGIGTKELIIAESTFGNGRITEQHFNKTGYSGLPKKYNKYNIKLLNLNYSRPKKIKVDSHKVLTEIDIAEEICEKYKIINLPVMKVHYATGLTIGIKNLKGFLTKDEKKHFHEVGLSEAIYDLSQCIIPHLTIVDGSRSMETMGPKGGNLVDLNCIVSGQNPGDVDWICSKIMGFEPEEVKHLQYYLSSIDFDETEITTVGCKIEDVYHEFERVDMKKYFPDNFTINSVNACSTCENALLLSLKLLGKTPEEEIIIQLGSKCQVSDKTCKKISVSFGNCSIKSVKNVLRVKGCPPYPFELKKIFKQNGIL